MTRARDLADGADKDITGTLTVDGLAVDGSASITTADNTTQLTLTSTDADNNIGPQLDLRRDSGSPADGDVLGRVRWLVDDDAGNLVESAILQSNLEDASQGTVDTQLQITTSVASTMRNRMKITGSEVVFNEDSIDSDFRVEGNSNANAFVVQGSNDFIGIGTGSPGANLDIESTGPNIHLNDSDGVLAGAITSRIVMQASGSIHGIVGFGSSVGNMAVTNAQGNLYLQADTNGAHSTSFIQHTVDNENKMRIAHNGSVMFSTDNDDTPWLNSGNDPASVINYANIGLASFARSGGDPLAVNRTSNDGDVIAIYQDGSFEGSIRVTGSTVSVVGGHISRWSQTSDGSKDTSIVRGTVMTNLNEMCEWKQVSFDYVITDDEGNETTIPKKIGYGGDADVGQTVTVQFQGNDVTGTVVAEDNEQLNRMAVSSVEGDVNVSGVMDSWDEDDDNYDDMTIAMTGDFVIRIAQGTTVARGDLLMSAGDGTAKPQDDDIVRSKTIAKVTSTTVSHTYDDGSYLVPCVLMAC